MALTKEQFTKLYNQGLSVEQIRAFEAGKKPKDIERELQASQPQQDGFFKSLVKAPIETLLVKPVARTTEVLGRTGVFGETIKRGFEEQAETGQQLDTIAGRFDIAPVKPADEGGLKQIIGESAETASYLIPAQRLNSIATNLFKGQIVRATTGGALTGAVGGGLFAGGEAIQEDKTAKKVTYDTLFGAGTGFLAGGLLAGTGAIGAKVYNNLKAFRTPSDARRILSNEYQRVINPTQAQRRRLTQEGRDMGEFLADELGTNPGVKLTGDGKLDLSEPIEALTTKYHAEELAFDRILQTDIRRFSWNDIRKKAAQKISQNLRGTERQRALDALDNEITAYTSQLGDNPNLSQINQLKRDMWTRTTGFGTPEAELTRKTNFNIGQAAKEFIEDKVDDIKVKDFNRRLGDFISTLKVLQRRNGGVSGTGGKMTALMTRFVGAVAGSGQGPIGTIVGALTGDRVAGLMANPEVSFGIIRSMMRNIPVQQRNQLLQEAKQILQTRARQVSERLLLPSPQAIRLGPRTLNPSTVRSVPAQRGPVGVDPQTGRFKRTFTSQ